MSTNKVSEFKKAINKLSPDKMQMLFEKIAHHKAHSKKTHNAPFPLSKIQELFYFHHHFQPLLCNIPGAVTIEGELDADALQKSLAKIIERHDTLRMKIYSVDDKLVQKPTENIKFKLNYVDLSTIPESIYDSELHAIMQVDFKRQFDLQTPPLIRASLIRRNSRLHTLTICLHHIIADGWSLGILMEELTREYESIKYALPSSIPQLMFDYGDFIEWQQDEKQRLEISNQLTYWKNLLSDAEYTLNLPSDLPRPKHRSGEGNTMTYSLSLELSENIRKYCHQKNVTLFMFMLSVYSVILYRYSNQSDFLIGTPISLRNPPQTEKLIGVFLNMIIFRIRLKPEMTFLELLDYVRDVALASYSNAYCPLSLIIETLRPKHTPGFSSLFQAFITHNNAPINTIECANLKLTPRLDEAGGADADIGFFYLDANTQITLRIEYAVDLFNSETINRIVKNIEQTIVDSLQNSTHKILNLQIISPEEKNLIRSFNAAADAKDPLCVDNNNCLSLINDRIKENPNKLILVGSSFHITYHQLPYAVNEVQKLFININHSGELIGVFLDNSVEAILVLLAVIQSGFAYVPIDVNSSQERLQLILEDANFSMIITDSKNIKALHNYQGIKIEIDNFKTRWEKFTVPKKKLFFHINAYNSDTVAFLIYTSGSTGKPKASMNTHGALSKKLLWQFNQSMSKPDDKTVGTCSLAFDVSIWEMLSSLVCNIQLHILSSYERCDPNALGEYINSHQISMFYVVPSVLRLLLENDSFIQSTTLHTVICLGEALSYNLIEKFYSIFNNARLYNYYGPSEACIFATARYCPLESNHQYVPIGWPIAGNDIIILDSYQNTQPIGVYGEIYITGSGIAKSYLNRPELTKSKFLRFQNYEFPLYRTGDVGRWLPNGEIEFQGRADHQIKFNGIRVELEEIECFIEKHPDVQQAVVVLRKNASDINQLHAFIQASQKISATDLRSFLNKYLLASVIPNEYYFIKQIPLNINNKKDREKLNKAPLDSLDLAFDNFHDARKHQSLQDWFYVPCWNLYDDLKLPTISPPIMLDKIWLIVNTNNSITERISTYFDDLNIKYTIINIEQLNNNQTKLIIEKLNQLGSHHHLLIPGLPNNAIHKHDLEQKLDQANKVEEFVFTNLLSFLKKYSKDFPKNTMIITAIINDLFQISTSDNIITSLQALLVSVLIGFSEEFSNFCYKIIDVPSNTISKIDECLNLLTHMPDNKLLSWVDGNVYEQSYRKTPINDIVDGSLLLANGDNYIIIGCGGIAIELADFLVNTIECSLIIITKTLELSDSKIDRLNKIKAKAKTVKLLQADITDYTSMKNIFLTFEKENITIHGIINTVGLFAGSTIRDTDSKEWEKMLSAKVQGALIFQECIKHLNLKFCYIFSSSTTIEYTIGTLGYYAANLYTDYYARQFFNSSPIRNIKWGMWRDIGMSDPKTLLHANEEFYYFRENYSLSSQQGTDAFKRALVCNCPELLITPEPVQADKPSLLMQTENSCSRISSSTDIFIDVEDHNKIESLKAIWHDVLPVKTINYDQTFFELGGHSLMAAQLINKINKKFNSNLKLRDLFQHPTINELALRIK